LPLETILLFNGTGLPGAIFIGKSEPIGCTCLPYMNSVARRLAGQSSACSRGQVFPVFL
jgi:hypothetical protein